MSNLKDKYPIQKFDHLDRLIYIDWNGFEREVIKYWDTSKCIKIKYTFLGKETMISAYDISGKEIMFFDSTSFKVEWGGVVMGDGGYFKVSFGKNKINEWKNRIKITKSNSNLKKWFGETNFDEVLD